MLYAIDEIRANLQDTKAISQQQPKYDPCFLIQANRTLHAWINSKNLLEIILNAKNINLVTPFWELCAECDIELTKREKEEIFTHLLDSLLDET